MSVGMVTVPIAMVPNSKWRTNKVRLSAVRIVPEKSLVIIKGESIEKSANSLTLGQLQLKILGPSSIHGGGVEVKAHENGRLLIEIMLS